MISTATTAGLAACRRRISSNPLIPGKSKSTSANRGTPDPFIKSNASSADPTEQVPNPMADINVVNARRETGSSLDDQHIQRRRASGIAGCYIHGK